MEKDGPNKKMKRRFRIRRRLGGAICLLPAVLFLLFIRSIFDYRFVDTEFILCLLIIAPFGGKLYDLIFYDSNTTCALYAGNLALEYGFSPKAQDGHIWDPEECRVSEVYSFYPDNRLPTPEPYTAGFMFYTFNDGAKSRHVEFYDYRAGGDTFVYFEFYFHDYEQFNDKTIRREMKVADIDSSKRFVKLEKL